jgi:hypothetical protein
VSSRFLIEVPHDPTMTACVGAIEVFHKSGSHFLTHANWGCKDGVHKAWMVVEVDSRDQAKAIVPPLFRSSATIVQLNEFSVDDVENLRRHMAD